MITSLHIAGFRSLADTKVELRPGLNVLVGPNGAGKSNFLDFLSFLQKFSTSSLDDAMAAIGGAGNAFRKLHGDFYDNSISVTAWGKITDFSQYPYARSSNGAIFYKYHFAVSLSERRDDYNISSEVLNFSYFPYSAKKFEHSNSENIADKDWQFHIKRKNTKEDQEFELETSAARRNYISNIKRLFSETTSMRRHMMDKIERLRTSILSRPSYSFWHLGLILEDFELGEIYNINPASARQSQDAAQQPGILKDGSGLAATLYSIQQNSQELAFSTPAKRRRMRRSRVIKDVSIEELLEQVRLVSDFISKIIPENDKFTNKISLWAYNDEGVRFPFSFLSDGTVKWITIVSALMSRANILAIEEPENFLHPNMQVEIIRLMKALYEKANRSVFLTTHSETLLNACEPDDIILCRIENGSTITRRVRDAALLAQEIQRSGFGIGHLYVTGVIEHA